MISWSNCSAYYSVYSLSNVLHGFQAYVLNVLYGTIKKTSASFCIHWQNVNIILTVLAELSLAENTLDSCVGSLPT